jgi:pyruvate dehydrogenase E1 component
MAQDGLASFEPAYVDELAVIMEWAFNHLQAPAKEGGSVYLRLSTLPLTQPARQLTDSLREGIIAGAFWQIEPANGAGLAVIYCGAIAPEAHAAHGALLDDFPGAGLLAVISADRLHADWLRHARRGSTDSYWERLLDALAPEAILVTILDGHPATLSWIGSVEFIHLESNGLVNLETLWIFTVPIELMRKRSLMRSRWRALRPFSRIDLSPKSRSQELQEFRSCRMGSTASGCG